MHGTTVLCVRRDNKVVIAADGQVVMGEHVMKQAARETQRLFNEKTLAGFAGATADALSLSQLTCYALVFPFGVVVGHRSPKSPPGYAPRTLLARSRNGCVKRAAARGGEVIALL
jgi:Proteasome subunit